MKIRFTTLLAFVLLLTACSTNKKMLPSGVSVFRFPQDWAGDYLGKVDIYNNRGLAMQVPIRLEISPTPDTNRWSWTMTYNEGEKADRRAYELLIRDAAKGEYAIDEKNGIILSAFYVGNALYELFEVQGTVLQVIHRKPDAQHLVMEIIVSDSAALSESGGINADIPPVSDFSIRSIQRSVLKKQ